MIGLLLMSACTDALGPGPEVAPDRVVFTSTRAGNVGEFGEPLWDLYAMNADGSSVTRLTSESAPVVRHLRLSPDETRVAFHSDVGGCYDVWVVGVDGTGLTRLTGVEAFERCNSHPEWSPDGEQIAFLTSRNVGQGRGWDVYVMGADGSNPRDVAANPSVNLDRANDYVVGWSPDGRVVLTSYRDGTPRTYLARPDGSGVEALFGHGRYLEPWWSPDGRRILAYLPADAGGPSIHLLDASGVGLGDLTAVTAGVASSVWAGGPWSLDGTRVAVKGREGGILVLDVAGVTPRPLTNQPVPGAFLDWTSDGRILFWRESAGDEELYLMEADGSGVVNLTNAPSSLEGSAAVWVPGG